MIVADTSIWISYLRRDDADLVDILNRYLRKDDVFAVSAIFGELIQGSKSKREDGIIQSIWDSLPKEDEHNLFMRAGLVAQKNKLNAKGVGLIDSYIMTFCLENQFALWTLDKKLQKAFDELNNEESQ